jgi:hypothetical protein
VGRHPGAVLVALAIVAVVPGCSETSQSAQSSFELFDGRTLAGWSQAGPGGFDVVDGTLRTRDGMGLLWYSEREFTDFELRLEWRVNAATDNSGVFLRFPNPGDDPWVGVDQGYEVQINDNPDGDRQKTSAIYNFAEPLAAASRPVGEWNDFRIRVVGQRYEVWLNGTLVNDFTSTDPARGPRGHVGLQNHDPGTRTQFRAITVTDL